jgi:arsenate reductase
MAELGMDISQQTSKTMDLFLSEPFDEVITVCDQANEACPFYPNAGNRRHWSIADPAGVTGTEHERLEAFRSVRDALRERIETELLWSLLLLAL